jgi:hypothetical protein
VLISRRPEGLVLVTQPEHARLAGWLAEAWGNDAFALGPARTSLVTAAARHDDGWETLDAAPVIFADEGRPAHFLEVSLEDTVGPYGAGVDRIYDDDVHAGVLASLHWSGLYSARWGLQDSSPLEHPAALAVVDAQEQRVARHARALWAQRGGLRSAFEAELWRDYEILQALDVISLALCLLDTAVPTARDAPVLAMAATLRPVVQPPGGRSVGAVPASNGRHVELALHVVEPHVVAIDPFPLTRSGLECQVAARRMADERYADPAAAAAAYHAAERVSLAITLVSSGDS